MSGKEDNSNIRLKSWIQFIISVAAIVLIAVAGSLLRVRLDLTQDKRYTLSEPTRNILSHLKNDFFVQVYLDGDIPIPLKRLKRSVREMLDEFRIASGKKIDYEFINPSGEGTDKQRNARYQSLVNKGLTPINIQSGDKEGGSSQKIIFPGMIINYNGAEVPVNILKNNPSLSSEENILHSTEGLEYELIQTIATLSSDTVYKVAFLEGQGEIPEIGTADITLSLSRFFTIDRGKTGGKTGILDNYAAVVVAGPEKEFSEADKLVLDQYIMNGGKVLWLLDEVSVNSDSLVYGSTVGLFRPLNIEDQLFRYGARVNPVVVQDLDCDIIRLKIEGPSGQQQYVPAPWVYYPLLHPSPVNPVTRNLNKVLGRFVNTIDTVGLDPEIHKTILLTTSQYSRTLSPPMLISLKEAGETPDDRTFNKSGLPVAVLLEGIFPSAFKNRMLSAITPEKNLKIRKESRKTKMILVA
ncbi:MAG TPA: gliding motility-associated ABC transporter substrate-binding protein GldG, partial [Bacteroidales bacterium]|nr:gliding motility-associated ABC transporter substrate-binding protein GldG [Bacteroidales bacterium]